MTISPSQQESDPLTPLVARVLTIESVTRRPPDTPYLVKYTGRLRKDSIEAYDQLAEALKPHKVTPLFREEGERHVVLLTEGVIEPQPSSPRVNLLLFVVTLFSMLFAGAANTYTGPLPEDEIGQMLTFLRNLGVGIPFGVSLLFILLVHEFGHYFAARYHHSAVTLPYFIPFPFSPFGTIGAFIRFKEPPKNKRVLHDIGVAGPLAGLVVAVPILIAGQYLSEVGRIALPGEAGVLEGNSIFYLLVKYAVHGEWLPKPVDFGGLSPWLYWLRYFFTGSPLPIGGQDVFMHPLAFAGWAGLLVTALNLIPAGQLDGGHTLYVLFGKRVERILPVIIGALALLGLIWGGWWLWVLLIYFFGRYHAEPLDQITKLDNRRRAVAVLTLAIFVLIFTPVPLVPFRIP